MTETTRLRPYELPAHGFIKEPSLKFHPQRADDTNEHPLQGLCKFGPYSRPVLGAVSDPIRVALVTPTDGVQQVNGLFAELDRRHSPRERGVYLVEFGGFSATFGVRVILGEEPRIILPTSVDQEIENSAAPHSVLAAHLARAVNALQTQRSEFDILLIYLPQRWQPCFTGGPNDDFDLHDFVKSHTASAGIPAQIVREDRALAYPCRCSVMWRFSIALYCKAGGIPWKLAYMEPDTAYIGLGYAVKYDERGEPTFLTTCSQVFDHDGTGLEFLAYETRDMTVERENPFLTRGEMYRVMARSLSLYQHRHGGHSPRAVVIHKLHPFKRHEADGCFDAFRAVESVDLVQIQKDALWRGAHLDPPRVPDKEKSRPGYACRRGSYFLLSDREALLWTQGNVPQARRDFFKEMKGTPRPLLLRRFAGHGPFSETCRQILALTKMNWNNDALYDRLPVTLRFASVLAQTLKRMPSLTSKPYPFRLFM